MERAHPATGMDTVSAGAHGVSQREIRRALSSGILIAVRLNGVFKTLLLKSLRKQRAALFV